MLGIDSWIVRSCFPPHPTATQLGYISRRGIAARDFSSTRRSRLAWSRAHDWKSCKRHKRFEGSNPSSSATAKRTGSARPFCCGGGGDGERTAPQNGSGKETIVLGYFIEAQKIIGGAGSAARGRTRERNAALFARRFRLTPKSVLARRSLAPVLFGDPEILMANIPQHSTFWKRRASSSLKNFSANPSTLDQANCPERGNTDPLLPVGVPREVPKGNASELKTLRGALTPGFPPPRGIGDSPCIMRGTR